MFDSNNRFCDHRLQALRHLYELDITSEERDTLVFLVLIVSDKDTGVASIKDADIAEVLSLTDRATANRIKKLKSAKQVFDITRGGGRENTRYVPTTMFALRVKQMKELDSRRKPKIGQGPSSGAGQGSPSSSGQAPSQATGHPGSQVKVSEPRAHGKNYEIIKSSRRLPIASLFRLPLPEKSFVKTQMDKYFHNQLGLSREQLAKLVFDDSTFVSIDPLLRTEGPEFDGEILELLTELLSELE